MHCLWKVLQWVRPPQEEYAHLRISPKPYSYVRWEDTLFPLACVISVQTTILKLCVRPDWLQHEIFLELQDFPWVISPFAIRLDKLSRGSAQKLWIITKCGSLHTSCVGFFGPIVLCNQTIQLGFLRASITSGYLLRAKICFIRSILNWLWIS